MWLKKVKDKFFITFLKAIGLKTKNGVRFWVDQNPDAKIVFFNTKYIHGRASMISGRVSSFRAFSLRRSDLLNT